jgi:hypothetical protein
MCRGSFFPAQQFGFAAHMRRSGVWFFLLREGVAELIFWLPDFVFRLQIFISSIAVCQAN